MRLHFPGLTLLYLFVVVTCAKADTFTTADVFPFSGLPVSQSDPTSSSAMIDANNFANSFVNPATGKMGVQTVSGPSNRADATASHKDTWSCSGSCSGLSTAPISLGILVEGTLSLGPTLDAQMRASYSIDSGDGFSFFLDEADGGVGANASYNFINGTHIDIPVAFTDNHDGTLSFSVKYSIATGMPSGCNNIPGVSSCPFSSGDNQSLSAETVFGSIDAFHTFGVTVTSLDPNIQLTSADGRTGGPSTAPVPEPATLAMLATGLAGIGVRLRFKRKMTA